MGKGSYFGGEEWILFEWSLHSYIYKKRFIFTYSTGEEIDKSIVPHITKGGQMPIFLLNVKSESHKRCFFKALNSGYGLSVAL